MFLPSAVAVVLDRTDRRALPVQIADHLRADIRSGKAAVGLRLPSSRKLAAGARGGAGRRGTGV